MKITGEMLIGSRSVRGRQGEMRAVNPATGQEVEPVFGGGEPRDVEQACELAVQAFDTYRATPGEVRAQFLERIAQGLLDAGSVLVERVMQEAALPQARVETERARTVGQLRLFAEVLRQGSWMEPVLDAAQPDRQPAPRPDLRRQKIPLGPVAVFGASNFPLAYSVAGGDTAAALAAGCPVVAKSHPSHLGASEIAGRVIQKAVAESNLPEGVFSLLVGVGNEVGEALVAHPAIQAVGFTGSRQGGLQLAAIAARRPVPIPVFAEMSSTNPVFLLPGALKERGNGIAENLIQSVTLGGGQFCTKPGIVVGIESKAWQQFTEAAAAVLTSKPAAVLLNASIHKAYQTKVTHTQDTAVVRVLAHGSSAAGTCGAAQAMLFATDAEDFLSVQALGQEIFGPSCLLVTCKNAGQMLAIAEGLEGQLTSTFHMSDQDTQLARALVTILERKAGRIIANGFPTGVEVVGAMVHGGPFPSTTDSRYTAVGPYGIERFLRPVCYQNFPAQLLPESLQDQNPLHLWRVTNGQLQQS